MLYARDDDQSCHGWPHLAPSSPRRAIGGTSLRPQHCVRGLFQRLVELSAEFGFGKSEQHRPARYELSRERVKNLLNKLIECSQ